MISVIGNAFPREFSKMVRLALEGDYDRARAIHHRFTELFSLLFVDGNPAGVKCVLNAMGYIENELRLPLVPTRITTYEKYAGCSTPSDPRLPSHPHTHTQCRTANLTRRGVVFLMQSPSATSNLINQI